MKYHSIDYVINKVCYWICLIHSTYSTDIFQICSGFGPDYAMPNYTIVDNLNPMFELSAVPPEFSGGIQCRTVGH